MFSPIISIIHFFWLLLVLKEQRNKKLLSTKSGNRLLGFAWRKAKSFSFSCGIGKSFHFHLLPAGLFRFSLNLAFTLSIRAHRKGGRAYNLCNAKNSIHLLLSLNYPRKNIFDRQHWRMSSLFWVNKILSIDERIFSPKYIRLVQFSIG